MKNPKCLQVRLSVLIIWQKVDFVSGAPESFSTNLMQKHQLFNPHALESKTRLLSFASELKCWRIGTLTLEDLHSHANPQLVCNKNNLFYMYNDNKAFEMCEAPFVVSTVALPVRVAAEDPLDKCPPIMHGWALAMLCVKKPMMILYLLAFILQWTEIHNKKASSTECNKGLQLVSNEGWCDDMIRTLHHRAMTPQHKEKTIGQSVEITILLHVSSGTNTTNQPTSTEDKAGDILCFVIVNSSHKATARFSILILMLCIFYNTLSLNLYCLYFLLGFIFAF